RATPRPPAAARRAEARPPAPQERSTPAPARMRRGGGPPPRRTGAAQSRREPRADNRNAAAETPLSSPSRSRALAPKRRAGAQSAQERNAVARISRPIAGRPEASPSPDPADGYRDTPRPEPASNRGGTAIGREPGRAAPGRPERAPPRAPNALALAELRRGPARAPPLPARSPAPRPVGRCGCKGSQAEDEARRWRSVGLPVSAAPRSPPGARAP